MIVHPEIAALRGDDAPQRHAQDALHAAAAIWRSAPENAAVLADFGRFAGGKPLASCPALAVLFAQPSFASSFARGFAAHFAAALSAHPLAHMPQRHFHDALSSTLALARHRGATLTLLAIDGDELSRRPEPRNTSFWPGEAYEMFLSGSARGALVRRCEPAPTLQRQAIDLVAGTSLARDAAREALILLPFTGLLVSLRLQRRDEHGAAEEVALDNGKVAHRSAGRPRDSRLELMMATLGRMGRREATPHLATIALSEASAALRWQALRECLALDTQAGVTALCGLAERSTDALTDPARALHRHLLAQYPQLAEVA